jgi:NTP pyrophosphatase (non-canonical NTP hydrolase)
MEIDREELKGIVENEDNNDYHAILARAVLYLLDKVEPKEAPADDLLARQIKSAETIRDNGGQCANPYIFCSDCPRVHYPPQPCPQCAATSKRSESNAAWMRSWLAEHKPAAGLRTRILDMMKKRGWSTHWIHRSAYLHLEAAELAEAVRGKHGDALEESGDVLITLLALSPYDLNDIIKAAEGKINKLNTIPPYPNEEKLSPPLNLDALDGDEVYDELHRIAQRMHDGEYKFYSHAIRDILRIVKEALKS